MASKNPNTYLDVASILDPALAAGGGKYQLASRGRAIRFVHRCYSLRIALRDIQTPTLLPGQAPYTKYDNMLLKITTLDGKPMVKGGKADQPHIVHILKHSAQGILTDLEGNPLTPNVGTTTPSRLEVEADEMFSADSDLSSL